MSAKPGVDKWISTNFFFLDKQKSGQGCEGWYTDLFNSTANTPFENCKKTFK